MLKDRIKTFIASKKLKNVMFEQMIGASNGYVKSIKDSISSDKIIKISKSFPELNINWLLTGEGQMLNSKQATTNILSNNSISNNDVIGNNLNADDIEKFINNVIKLYSEQATTLPDIYILILENKNKSDNYKAMQDRIEELKEYIQLLKKHLPNE